MSDFQSAMPQPKPMLKTAKFVCGKCGSKLVDKATNAAYTDPYFCRNCGEYLKKEEVIEV